MNLKKFNLSTLVIDDDQNIRQILSVGLASFGCHTHILKSGEDALKFLETNTVDLVITDLKMEGKSGLDVIREIAIAPYEPPLVVLMTAFASYDNAVDAIRAGAFDYIPKPFSIRQLEMLLEKIWSVVSLKRENKMLRQKQSALNFFAGLTSPSMVQLAGFVRRLAPTQATVLLTGESGTGKSALARQIHASSDRSYKPFVEVACTNLAEGLLESELFGHVKGAFTGALHDRIGKLELAGGGTLFLDEIGDLSPVGQTKILHFLQNRTLERMGGNQILTVDTRVIAATNKNLLDAVENGKFRDDLYFRLNVFEYTLVPLRFRKEDIPILMQQFLQIFNPNTFKEVPGTVLELMLDYHWPGNVRELRNCIERISLLSQGREITREDLPAALTAPRNAKLPCGVLVSLEDMERAHIKKVLDVEPNMEKVAEILKVAPSTLWRKRKEYGLI